MKTLLGLMVMVAVVVSCSFGKRDATNSSSTANSNNATKTETSTATNGAGLTRAKYEQMQMGTTYEEVVKILGGPGEEAETYTANSAKVVKYRWTGDNNARITATFSNGKLSFKTRANLK